MNYTQDQAKKIYQSAKDKGLDPDAVMAKLVAKGAVIEGIDMNQAREFASRQSPQESGYLQRVGSGLKEQALRAAQGVETGATAMEQGLNMTDANGIITPKGVVTAVGGLLRSGLRAAGSAANAISIPTVEAPGVKQATETVVGGAMKGIQELPGGAEAFQKLRDLAVKNPEIAKDVEDIFNLVTVGGGAKVAKVGAEGAIGAVKTGAKEVAQEGIDTIASKVPLTKDAILQSIAPEIDDTVKQVLKNTSKEKFDVFVKVAEEGKKSQYEQVSESLTNATKRLSEQKKSLAEQKDSIMAKAKTGLTDFKKDTGTTILSINKQLGDTPIGKQFIERLKKVNTKADADKAIDDLQNVLYKGNKDMTIPTGSKEDKILRGIIGEYNSNLKSTLPKSYGKLNTEISNRIKAINILNKSLGETVNGVPVRGAGLVKQYFSPSNTKTRELFDYIKKTTGVDLAEDAVLAKYIGEAYGDTKVRSLLEGIPTSTSGVVDKAINFTLEKVGANKALKEINQKGAISKARKLTK